MADLIITAPETGIASSPLKGFADIRNCDIFSIPGVIKLNNPLVKKSGSTVIGLIKWMVKNPATPAEVYAIDEGGRVYKSTDSGDTWALMTGFTAGGHGNGLAIWKNYLFVARDAYIDVCGDGTATGITNANWTNSWKAIDSDALWHPFIVSKLDSMLYGGAGKFIFSLDENTGQTFAPANSATYTWTQQALDLPSNYRIKSLSEQGNNLMCGTWMGTNIYDFKIADVFPWDRSSPSFIEPIQVQENGVNAMLNIGGFNYILGGIDGKIQLSNGVSSSLIGQIPQSVSDLSGGKYLEPMPGSLINHKGRPFFGISTGSGNISGMGIWSLLQTSKGNILNCEHLISTGNDGTSATLKIGSLLEISRDVILVGWQDGSSYGIDKVNTSAVSTGYTGFIISPLYIVGTSLQPRKFSEIEFTLIRPLRTNEGIKLEYRTNLTDDFTLIGTYDFATWGAKISKNSVFAVPVNEGDINASEQIQLKISMTGTTTSPLLRQVILR